jgi:L-glutamine-phosphate cytidylyltransferase
VKAIILAAGRGGRLGPVIGDRPKCLARLGPRTLLERQIAALQHAGINRITVVGGYGIDLVRQSCPRTVELVQNARYATTNSLYSLWLARHLLLDGFIVLNCDVLFHPQMLSDLLTARCDDALLVAARRDGAPYGDEEMKVRIRRGLVSDIAKTLGEGDSDAENVGIARFSAAGALALVDHMNRIVASGEVREWLPRAFAAFAAERPLHAVDSRGFPWIEIDFPEDYWRACSDVMPAIDADTFGTTGSAAASAGGTFRHV